MSKLGQDLIESLTQAVAMKNGAPVGRVTTYPEPREVRRKANLTQEQMAPLLGLSVSGYRKIEQGQRSVQGPAAVLLQVLDREPDVVKRALMASREEDDHFPGMTVAEVALSAASVEDDWPESEDHDVERARA